LIFKRVFQEGISFPFGCGEFIQPSAILGQLKKSNMLIKMDKGSTSGPFKVEGSVNFFWTPLNGLTRGIGVDDLN